MGWLKFNTCAWVSMHLKLVSIHLGVYRDPRWEWGFHTEPYDQCLEYFSLGPFLMLCWLPRDCANGHRD